jgi:hypothetical protein
VGRVWWSGEGIRLLVEKVGTSGGVVILQEP